jgi:hypothetical protein
MRMKTHKAAAASIAAFTVAIGFFVGVTPANAIGGDCNAVKEVDGRIGLDGHRARAWCDSLNADSRARPKLIRNGGPDYTGPYFTAIRTNYYTKWYSCYAGCSAAYEIAHV